MEGENNRSSDALLEKVSEDSEALEEREGENRGEKVEKIPEQRRVSSDTSSDCAVRSSSRGESKASQFQTLAPVELPGGDFRADFDDSSDHLSEVPVEYSLQPLHTGVELKDQVKAVHKEVSKDIGGKCSPSATKSISSVASSNLPKQKLLPVENGSNVHVPEQDKQNSKRLSIVPTPRTPSDGYNWRKYGQKQVKSPEGSRSYYRCTFSDCHAKKIECCDTSSRLIETVYRSHHNHEPPQKLNSIRENKPVLSTTSTNGSKYSSHLVRHLNDPVPSTPSKEQAVALSEAPETKQESSGSDETTETNSKDGDGSESKKRQKRNTSGEIESLPKPGKKPKYVVHAAGDVGISGDGYRWRKYGQKMVKGNPHPRNYYRCTSAGCPVRKHIERAVDNSNAVVITYKGIHDHDTPVPRKRHGPKSGVAVATSPVSLHDMQNKSKPHNSQQTQWSVDKEGELTGEALVGGDKASEPARTLLSVGFEIKPC